MEAPEEDGVQLTMMTKETITVRISFGGSFQRRGAVKDMAWLENSRGVLPIITGSRKTETGRYYYILQYYASMTV